jgi:hypothetical protein
MTKSLGLARSAAIALAASLIASAAAAETIKIPEGTEMVLRLNDDLSSGTSTEGDQFSVTLKEPVELGHGVVLPPGYRGRGEVAKVKKKGFAGQGGELNIRMSYIKIGDTRVRLRASKGQQGQGAMGATVALTVLFGPLGLLKHGHDVEMKAGQSFVAYVDADTELDAPVSPPPRLD